MKETELAPSPAMRRGDGSDANEQANYAGFEQRRIPAEMLTDDEIKIPCFTAILRRLSLLPPRAWPANLMKGIFFGSSTGRYELQN